MKYLSYQCENMRAYSWCMCKDCREKGVAMKYFGFRIRWEPTFTELALKTVLVAVQFVFLCKETKTDLF